MRFELSDLLDHFVEVLMLEALEAVGGGVVRSRFQEECKLRRELAK